ncbi:MAG: shikimate kinase, partial [Candidatus Omnitrophica bacterium]|nr:shikimate kinase [Candidatus Omnitrophota bacterium]
MKIVLLGYRCSGKTLVGREVAHRLGIKFIDTDALVEERAGKSVANIFAQDGEDAFRAFERRAIA